MGIVGIGYPSKSMGFVRLYILVILLEYSEFIS